MSTTVLYIDRLNQAMEKMAIEMCPEDVKLTFLDPVKNGVKGVFEDADVLWNTTAKINRDIIDMTPKLKLIQRTGVGVDNTDVAYAREKGIPVSICKGMNAVSVAELAILHMMALYRRIVTLDNLGKKGEWHTWTYRLESFELLGKTIGVFGAGAIGREVIKRVKAFGTRVIYNDIVQMSPEDEKALGCEYVSFNDLIVQSDILTIHAPWLESTTGIIGKKQFEQMKRTAILVNTARSNIVNHEDLIDALENKLIMGAGVDVYEPEDPLHGIEAQGLNLIVTPHIGAATFDNYDRVYKFCFENAQRIGRGESPLFTL